MNPRVRQAALPLLVLAGGMLVAMVLIATRSEPEKLPRVDRGTLVDTWTAVMRRETLTVPAQGVVTPALRVVLQPQVGGRVVAINDALVPGGIVAAGEVLFRIEAADYELALETARTQLAEAEAQLALEQGRQRVAEREWALFADERDADADPALALRQPQLAAAEAAVAAARARLGQAELNLARTRVAAPFNSLVLDESVDLGQTLSPQSQAAVLVGTDQAWIRATLPVGQLDFIRLPAGDGAGGSVAEVSYDAGGTTQRRQGRVVRLLGDLDPAGRLARVLIAIDDPLSLKSGDLPLLFESYVDLEIESDRVADVVALDRAWLHGGDRVYLYGAGGELEIRPVEVGWRRPDVVMVSGGIEAGELVITSPLATAVEGMKLRLQDEPPVASESGAESAR